MDKVTSWNGMTQSHGFQVEVYRDTKAKDFVAEIHTSSPALTPQHIPGSPTLMMKFDDPEEVRHEELDKLREITKQTITNRRGKILQFFEK